MKMSYSVGFSSPQARARPNVGIFDVDGEAVLRADEAIAVGEQVNLIVVDAHAEADRLDLSSSPRSTSPAATHCGIRQGHAFLSPSSGM